MMNNLRFRAWFWFFWFKYVCRKPLKWPTKFYHCDNALRMHAYHTRILNKTNNLRLKDGKFT